MSRVFSRDDRLEGAKDGSQPRREEAFPESANPLICFNSYKRPVEIPLDDAALQANDFHSVIPQLRGRTFARRCMQGYIMAL